MDRKFSSYQKNIPNNSQYGAIFSWGLKRMKKSSWEYKDWFKINNNASAYLICPICASLSPLSCIHPNVTWKSVLVI